MDLENAYMHKMQNSQENTSVGVFFLNKVVDLRPFLQKTSARLRLYLVKFCLNSHEIIHIVNSK